MDALTLNQMQWDSGKGDAWPSLNETILLDY
jgi:hypothetical protein